MSFNIKGLETTLLGLTEPLMSKRQRRESKLIPKIGSYVRDVRVSRGLTQGSLAELIGVEPETISRLERGVALPSLVKLEEIALALRVSLGAMVQAGSSEPVDQADQMASWMLSLTVEQREFILSIVKMQCQYFTASEGRPIKRRSKGV